MGSFFSEAWHAVKQVDLTYSHRESWQKLRTIGMGLLARFRRRVGSGSMPSRSTSRSGSQTSLRLLSTL